MMAVAAFDDGGDDGRRWERLISAVNAGGVGIFPYPLPPLHPAITVGKSKEQKQTGPRSTLCATPSSSAT